MAPVSRPPPRRQGAAPLQAPDGRIVPALVVDELVDTANHLRYVARLLSDPQLSQSLHDVAQSVEAIAKTVR